MAQFLDLNHFAAESMDGETRGPGKGTLSTSATVDTESLTRDYSHLRSQHMMGLREYSHILKTVGQRVLGVGCKYNNNPPHLYMVVCVCVGGGAGSKWSSEARLVLSASTGSTDAASGVSGPWMHTGN